MSNFPWFFRLGWSADELTSEIKVEKRIGTGPICPFGQVDPLDYRCFVSLGLQETDFAENQVLAVVCQVENLSIGDSLHCQLCRHTLRQSYALPLDL